MQSLGVAEACLAAVVASPSLLAVFPVAVVDVALGRRGSSAPAEPYLAFRHT